MMKGATPRTNRRVEMRQKRIRLRRSAVSRRQRTGIGEQLQQSRSLGSGGERRFHTRGRTAGKRAPHLAHARFNASRRLAPNFDASLLQMFDAAIEWDGIEAAGEDDTSAACSRCAFVRIDHVAHPGGFTAEVGVACAGRHASFDKRRAVELIGADGRNHDARAFSHGAKRGGIGRICNDE
jgi:hypothetical protein